MPHSDNVNCDRYYPINITTVSVKEKEEEMSDLFCHDCQDHATATTIDGPNPYCMYHGKDLSEFESSIARNVPPGAYGFCRAFCPEEHSEKDEEQS